MKAFRAVIFAIGLATLGLLLWKLDAGEVLRLIGRVGWLGFAVILLQECVPHGFNALGWRYAIPERHAPLFRFSELYRHRVQGDGVNYLTPSATIAGEYTRALLIDNAVPSEVRVGSVVTAKCTQSLAQILVGVVGTGILFPGSAPSLARYDGLVRWGALAFTVVLAAAAGGFYALARRREGPRAEDGRHWLKAVPGQVRDFYLEHPLRWWASVGFFGLGYVWTAFEVWWICRCLGVDFGLRTAVLIEVLSNVADMVFFMVPAKVGTQEAGKTGILHVLGLGAQTGLALGIIRHIRELFWAALGMALYTYELRRNPDATLKRAAGAPAAAVPSSN